MPQIRKHRRGDRRIRSGDWNNIADVINGGVGHRPPPLNSTMAPTVLVRNDTGVDLDRYDCISLGDPIWSLAADGSVDLIFAGEAAKPDKPAAILTEPIAHDATNKRFGQAWIYGLAYAAVGPAASVTDLTAAPDPANARLAPGSGNVQLLAAPSTTVETILPVLLGGVGSTAANREILRLGFEGRDSSNTHRWDEFFGTLLGWVNFSDYSGAGDIAAPSLGISVVTNTGTGAPADAEMLHFDNPGTYRLTIAYQIGVDSNAYAMRSAATAQWLGGGGSGDVGIRYLRWKGTGFQSGANIETVLDHRILKTTGSNDLHIGVSGLPGTGTAPPAIGWISVE